MSKPVDLLFELQKFFRDSGYEEHGHKCSGIVMNGVHEDGVGHHMGTIQFQNLYKAFKEAKAQQTQISEEQIEEVVRRVLKEIVS